MLEIHADLLLGRLANKALRKMLHAIGRLCVVMLAAAVWLAAAALYGVGASGMPAAHHGE